METPSGDEPASAAPDPRDRRASERRSGADRRHGTVPPAGVERRQGDRRGPDRRSAPGVPDQYRGNVRSINEYPLDPDELEFINAINAYKQRYSRPFPTWSEVLHVLRFLGYGKTSAKGGATGGGPSGAMSGGTSGATETDGAGSGATAG